MRDRYLVVAEPPRQIPERLFVLRVTIAVHQHDGAGAKAPLTHGAQLGFRTSNVQWLNDAAIGADALAYFDDFRMQGRESLDAQREQGGAVLVADSERIGKAARGHQQRRFALTLEQRVRRHGRAHAHDRDAVCR